MYIDPEVLHSVLYLVVPKTVLVFVVAYLFFVKLPQFIFPQIHTGGGLEKKISNILYLLVFIELVVPLLVLLKIFNMVLFFVLLGIAKLLFLKMANRNINIGHYIKNSFIAIFTKLLDMSDNIEIELLKIKSGIVKRVKFKFYRLKIDEILFKILFVAVFAVGIYSMGCKNFYSLSNALPDVAQFVEWVKNLDMNILYSDTKAFGADFYGLSVFVFILYKLTNVDLIVLFNIYPLLLITFVLIVIYFFVQRMTFNRYIALLCVLIFSTVLVGSPLNHYLVTTGKTVEDPAIVTILDTLRIYDLRPEHIARGHDYATRPISRYTAGLPYEFASAFFLLNLYYLIQIFRKFKKKYLINYTLSLMLVFIFHGGGAIVLIFPSLLIFFNALVHKRVSVRLLGVGTLAIVISAILGNLWVLSFFKYGIPASFGAAAPFLDYLFETKHVTDYIKAGVNAVSIMDLTYFHGILWLLLLVAFIASFFMKGRFVCSSYLLITFGSFLVFFSSNLGFGNIVKIYRSAEYVMLGLMPLMAFYFYFIFYFLKSMEQIILSLTLALDLIFVPKYCFHGYFWKSVDHIQYNTVAYYTYKIIEENRILTWTIVSYVQEYAKVLGQGFMVNTNDFVLTYDPKARFLEIPTNKVYIFVEDLPHHYKGSHEWYYRWRNELSLKLKEWISIYSLYHDNIKIYAKTKNLTIYEIDNTEYMREVLSKERS